MMPNYGTHTYTTDLQGLISSPTVALIETVEWEVSITVACTSRYRPAQLGGPPEHCDPASPAEYEFDEFRLSAGKVLILKTTDWAVAEALLGKRIWRRLYDDAVVDAEENHVREEVG